MNNYVYIIYSEVSDRYYVGSTCDWVRRLSEHNAGYVNSIKNGRPWVVKRLIPVDASVKVKSVEYKLKKYKRRDIIEKVVSDGIFPWEHVK
jgi:putative endonuclease